MESVSRAYIAALVRRAQKKDSDAFAELYALTYKSQYLFAKKYLRDHHLAQDAIQEVYILALKSIDKIKEPRYFTTWLQQINFRVCYDMAVVYKRNSHLDESLLDEVPDKNAAQNPETKIFEEMDNLELKEAILKLPSKEKTAIILKYSGNMSLQDIAEIMECSVSSVSRYLSQGYKALKKMIEGGTFS